MLMPPLPHIWTSLSELQILMHALPYSINDI